MTSHVKMFLMVSTRMHGMWMDDKQIDKPFKMYSVKGWTASEKLWTHERLKENFEWMRWNGWRKFSNDRSQKALENFSWMAKWLRKLWTTCFHQLNIQWRHFFETKILLPVNNNYFCMQESFTNNSFRIIESHNAMFHCLSSGYFASKGFLEKGNMSLM